MALQLETEQEPVIGMSAGLETEQELMLAWEGESLSAWEAEGMAERVAGMVLPL